jgi:ketosteroid isomerase-like protein
VFHNHTAGETVAGSDKVREHIAGIFRNWPGMRFTGRSLYVRDGLIVQEWTATGTHAESGRSATWDGMDILPTRDGRFARKDVYSDSMSVMRQLGRL